MAELPTEFPHPKQSAALIIQEALEAATDSTGPRVPKDTKSIQMTCYDMLAILQYFTEPFQRIQSFCVATSKVLQ